MFEAYGPLLYEIGLADENQLDHITTETAKGVQYIAAGLYYEAFLVTMPFPVARHLRLCLLQAILPTLIYGREDGK